MHCTWILYRLSTMEAYPVTQWTSIFPNDQSWMGKRFVQIARHTNVMYFNVTESWKFFDKVSDSILQPTFEKLVLFDQFSVVPKKNTQLFSDKATKIFLFFFNYISVCRMDLLQIFQCKQHIWQIKWRWNMGSQVSSVKARHWRDFQKCKKMNATFVAFCLRK